MPLSLKYDKPKKGFTIVELLVVISIIAILSVIGFVVLGNVTKGARDSKRISDLNSLRSVLEIYYKKNGSYTPATQVCTSSWNAAFNNNVYGVGGSAGSGCPSSLKLALSSYFSSNIPQDPFCSNNNCSSNYPDFLLDVPSGGQSFTIFAKLETAPSNPCPTADPDNLGRNYCVKN